MTHQLLLHGITCKGFHVDPIKRATESKELPSTTLTLLGHGDDRTDLRGVTFERLIEQVIRKMDEIGDTQYVLTGHSAGGMLVEEVIAIDSRAYAQVLIASPARGGLRSLLPFLPIKSGALLRLARPEYLGALRHRTPFSLSRQIHQDLFAGGGADGSYLDRFGPESGAWLREIVETTLFGTYPEGARRVKTLVCGARDDRIIARRSQLELIRHYGAEYAWFDTVHMFPGEQAVESLAARMKSFFGTLHEPVREQGALLAAE